MLQRLKLIKRFETLMLTTFPQADDGRYRAVRFSFSLSADETRRNRLSDCAVLIPFAGNRSASVNRQQQATEDSQLTPTGHFKKRKTRD
jgi:hypothetical protein